MKKLNKLGLSIALLMSTSVMAATAQNVGMKDDAVKRESYAVGLELGKNIAKNITLLETYGIPYDVDMLIEGIRANIKKVPQLSEAELKQALDSINNKMKVASQEKKAKNKVINNSYLKENIKKEGYKETASGLQYKVIRKGNGAKPSASSKVKVNYSGALTNGNVFDSSYKRGQPSEFAVNQVISGWTEGLQLMSVGSKFEFVIPSELGYGERGTRSGSIPPNAVLIFEVELLEIK